MIFRRRNNYPRGGSGEKLKKILKVSQCRNWVNQHSPYLYILSNTLGSCPKPKNCRQPIRIDHEQPSHFVSQSELSTKNPFQFVSQSESSITSLESSTNQNRVLRHSSRQPIRIGYYATLELSTRVEDPYQLESARYRLS